MLGCMCELLACTHAPTCCCLETAQGPVGDPIGPSCGTKSVCTCTEHMLQLVNGYHAKTAQGCDQAALL